MACGHKAQNIYFLYLALYKKSMLGIALISHYCSHIQEPKGKVILTATNCSS